MTHKSIDALLASTMFLLFSMVTPHYEDIAKKLVVIDHAFGATYYNAVNTLPSAGSVSTASASTTTSGTTSGTSTSFMTTLSATTPVSHPVSSGSNNVELAQFLVINSGPDMKITDIAFSTIGTAGANSIKNIKLYDVNNTQIADPKSVTSGGTTYFKNLSIVKSGKDLKIIVKADVSSTFTSADNGKTIGIAFAAGKATNTSDNTVVDMGKSVNANLMTLSTASLAKPSITLLTPNGGENFPVGGKMAVRWTTQNVPATNNVTFRISNIDIPLGVNDGDEVVVIPSTNKYGYVNPGAPTQGGLSTASIWTLSADKSYDVYDYSDQQVGIKSDATNSGIQVVSPNGGEVYVASSNSLDYFKPKFIIYSEKQGIYSISVVKNNSKTDPQKLFSLGEYSAMAQNGRVMELGRYYEEMRKNPGNYYLMAEWKSKDGSEDFVDFSDATFSITENSSSALSCGKTVSNTKDLPYNSAGVSFQFFPDSSINTAEIGTKDVDIGDGFFVNGKGCLTELSLDFYSGWEGTVLEGPVYLMNSDGDILSKAILNNYSQATFKDINFELDGQDTLFVAVDLANEFKPKNVIHTLNQHVTIMGYKYIRSDHDTIYNINDGVNRLGTVIVYDDVEPQTIPADHLYIKNTTKSNTITASSKRNTKIATFDMQGYLGAKPGNITFQFGSDKLDPKLDANSLSFVNTKTGDKAKLVAKGWPFYTFDFSEVRHEWDTMQTYALYVNKPKVTSSKPKTYPVSYLGVQEANNMDNYGSDVMFLKLTIKK